MAEITLKYDARNTLAKKTLDYILSLGIFKKITKVREALDEVKEGKIDRYESVDDFFEKEVG